MGEAAVRLTLLTTDDDLDWQFIFQRAARRAMFPGIVREVATGEEMLAYLRREGKFQDPASAPRPDLVLLDVNLPGMNGFETLAAMREDPATSDVPVVMLSTSRREADARRALELGARAFVTKPLTYGDLVDFLVVLARDGVGPSLPGAALD